MLTSDFDYELPPSSIAQTPVDRGASRLLTLPREGAIGHRAISDLPTILAPGDLLVVNNTRVLAARLFGHRSGGGQSEILLIEPRNPNQSLEEAEEWICLGRPRKRMPPGQSVTFGTELAGQVLEHREPDRLLIRFSAPPARYLDRLGHVPLPPYIAREDSEKDRERYQTVYAEDPGAIAAPTAGLHFSQELLASIESKGVQIAKITLHVGPGTFRPVTAQNLDDHRMESERFTIGTDAANAIAATRKRGGNVIAVGTTVVRTLEAAARDNGGPIVATNGSTDLFIRPGFEFRVVDRLLTNFHLPRSTLLVLVSAFAGRGRVLATYQEAVANGYRFYSYGDAMLVDHVRPR